MNVKPRQRRAVGPRLRKVLWVLLGTFALLGVNSVYLLSIRVLERATGQVYQNYFYTIMFGFHLLLGGIVLVPTLAFAVLHARNTWRRPNRNAVRIGYALLAATLILMGSGVILTRFDLLGYEFNLRNNDAVESMAWWSHVLAPLVVVWLFVLHRLAGPRLRWRVGVAWAVVAGVFSLAMVGLHSQDPRRWNVTGPAAGEAYFFPSLARTATGNFIPARAMMMDDYCQRCHPDVHERWSNSVHRFSSFNNPAYLAAVRETRKVALERDGDVQASRFCAGCHDLVPFFSGAFDDPEFDDQGHPTADKGITCTGCHAITNINSPRGNGDYTIEEPIHYPFAYAGNPLLQWLNRQLVKANPEFHKRTFLKPLHRTTEFCGSCHKVHLPAELNHYRWLRGQNHYDSFLLSGVSGHGAQSFYYPEKAEPSCNNCHMKPRASDDFAAHDLDGNGTLEVHDHQFPSANTAVPLLVGRGPEVVEEHRAFNEGVMRLDIFGIKDGGTIDGALTAPVRPEVPALLPGRSYLLEIVVRTVKMGHEFTQGTADSNEVWVDVGVADARRCIGRSGGRAEDGEVDPWSHFVNAYVLDREGQRISRRNAQDIFVPLYNHQIPPGAAEVLHYRLDVPLDAEGEVTVNARLYYRKFDTTYVRFFQEDPGRANDLPVMLLASDQVVFPVAGGGPAPAQESSIPPWQRWNDYGIGLLRKGDGGSQRGELRQAEEAFRTVEALGRADGSVNLARVYFKEGRVEEASASLRRAAGGDPPAPSWVVDWLSGLVNRQNGFLDEAVANFRSILELDTEETRRRGFDFSRDYRVRTELGRALFDLAKREREAGATERRRALLEEAREALARALVLDPENVSAHWGLTLVYEQMGDAARAEHHRALHGRYKSDENARDRAVARARRDNPAADHAAESIVIYDLHRPGAYGGAER
ncbi:MAG: multiheme c-type cytochrome [Planctomycetota bacterium]